MSQAAQIRWMFRSDTEAVSKIRDECATGSRKLSKVLASPSCILKVAIANGQVSGFINYKNSRNRIKILEFAVHRDFRRKGVGSELVGCIISKASAASKSVEAIVPEHNLAAQLFLKKCGFCVSKIIHSANVISYKFTMESKCQKESF